MRVALADRLVLAPARLEADEARDRMAGEQSNELAARVPRRADDADPQDGLAHNASFAGPGPHRTWASTGPRASTKGYL